MFLRAFRQFRQTFEKVEKSVQDPIQSKIGNTKVQYCIYQKNSFAQAQEENVTQHARTTGESPHGHAFVEDTHWTFGNPDREFLLLARSAKKF